ncbi:hypothetical protein PO909_026340 [Leuciscus waleckii]
MSQLARHLLLWSHKCLRSLRAIYIPGELSRVADELSRQRSCPGEWRLHPQTVQLIWEQFGNAQVDMSRSVEPACVGSGRDAEGLSTLPPQVVATITSARPLSTRHAYALMWNLFVTWCSFRREDPRKCPIGSVLSFLQEGLERRLSPSTLKVYVAAICAHHNLVESKMEFVTVCYGGQKKGKALPKQRLSHWIVDAIVLAYQVQGLPR